MRMKWEGETAKYRVRAGANRGLRMALDDILTDSLAIVPRDTDALADSAGTDLDEASLTGTVFYDQGRYSIIQHEKLRLRHDRGESAKYLEKPFIRRATATIHRLAAEINREMR